MTSDSQLINQHTANFHSEKLWKTYKRYSHGSLKKMLGHQCVVQGCNNTPNLEEGISLHISPKNKTLRDKWARFMRTHQANFTPQGSSEHFGEECFFERSLHVKGSPRTLRPGSIPTIWMKQISQEQCSSRSVQTRKKVSTCFLLF